MPRAFSAMTSLRPTINPAEFKLVTARRIADFFRRVIEPAGARGRLERARRRFQDFPRVPFSVISRMTYFRAFRFADSFEILIARTFFIIRRRIALSAFERVVLVLLTHILSDVV